MEFSYTTRKKFRTAKQRLSVVNPLCCFVPVTYTEVITILWLPSLSSFIAAEIVGLVALFGFHTRNHGAAVSLY